jgi:nucleotide-binding universal stress UspA family protein
VIVGVGGSGAHQRVVDTAVCLARGTGAVLYAVDVRDDESGVHVGPPASQDAYEALARAAVSADDLDVRIVITPGVADETLLRGADQPGDLLVLGHCRSRSASRRPAEPFALRCASRARCSVVVVPCEIARGRGVTQLRTSSAARRGCRLRLT